MPREVGELYESFKAYRFVQVFIADNTEPLYLSPSLLIQSSPYFEELLSPAEERDPDTGGDVLRFPYDNLDAWKWMLFWMTQKQLPNCTETSDEDSGPSHLVECWFLGEQYEMSLFQNAIMEQLISCIQLMGDIPLDAIAVAFENSYPEDKIRKLMMEGLAWLLHTGSLEYGQLEAFDGIAGFMSALTEIIHCTGYSIDGDWLDSLSHDTTAYLL